MTSVKGKNKTYTKQFKEETVVLVTNQGYTVQEAANSVGVHTNQIYNWEQRIAVAIGMPVTRHPLHRSQRALLTHWAPTLGIWRQSDELLCAHPPQSARRSYLHILDEREQMEWTLPQ